MQAATCNIRSLLIQIQFNGVLVDSVKKLDCKYIACKICSREDFKHLFPMKPQTPKPTWMIEMMTTSYRAQRLWHYRARRSASSCTAGSKRRRNQGRENHREGPLSKAVMILRRVTLSFRNSLNIE